MSKPTKSLRANSVCINGENYLLLLYGDTEGTTIMLATLDWKPVDFSINKAEHGYRIDVHEKHGVGE